MRSKRPTETDSEERDGGCLFHFGRDNRGIEGLPIRLVIAIVIGVAALAIMMTMLEGLDTFDDEEITIGFENDEDSVIETGEEFQVVVVDENGNGIEGAQVIAKEGTARIEESGDDLVVESNEEGEAEFNIDPQLPQGQATGKIEFEINPPADSSYTEADDHKTVTVVPDE